jgi:hypothetical protein
MTFVLSALAAAALVGAWTASAPAALVAGALYAFAPWRFHELHGVHLECAFYLPLVFLLAERWLARGRAAALVGMTVALAAQALAAYSLAYPAFAAAIPFVVVLALAARRSAAAPVGGAGRRGGGGRAGRRREPPYLRVQASDPARCRHAAWTPRSCRRAARVARELRHERRRAVRRWPLARPRRDRGGARASPAASRRRAGARPLVAAVLATALCLVLLSLGRTRSSPAIGRSPGSGARCPAARLPHPAPLRLLRVACRWRCSGGSRPRLREGRRAGRGTARRMARGRGAGGRPCWQGRRSHPAARVSRREPDAGR